jgi:raffinose/stachyose/melibiose transport system permease protein
MNEPRPGRVYIGRSLWYIFAYMVCGLMALAVLVPLYIAVMGGFKSMGQLMLSPLSLPAPFFFNQYTDMLTGKLGIFWQLMRNSLIVSGLTVAMTLVLCCASAFALARIKTRISKFINAYFILGLLFPLTVAILPIYIQIRNMKLIDTFLGVILPQVAFQIPTQVMLLRGFFKAIPDEIEDACTIDGHGPLGFLFWIVLPLSTPILATTSILTLVASWNNFFFPLLVFNSEKLYTLPMGVMNFQGQHATFWNQILAYLTLSMVPAVILFIFAQRYIVAGLTGGALKG